MRSDPKGLLLLLRVSACRSFSCSQVLSALYYDFNLLLSTPCHAPPVSRWLLLVSVTRPAFLLVCSYCYPLCKDALEFGLGLWKGFLFTNGGLLSTHNSELKRCIKCIKMMICSFSFYRSDANLFCIRVLPLWSQHHYLDIIFLDSNWTCGGLTYPWSCQWSINNQAEALSHWVRWTFQDPIAFLCMEEIWGNNWIWRYSFAKVLWAAWKQEGLLEYWTLPSGAIRMFWVIFLLEFLWTKHWHLNHSLQ